MIREYDDPLDKDTERDPLRCYWHKGIFIPGCMSSAASDGDSCEKMASHCVCDGGPLK